MAACPAGEASANTEPVAIPRYNVTLESKTHDCVLDAMADTARPNLSQAEFRGRIGVARRDATPPLGIYSRTWGSALHDTAAGVHRPLLATCLVFRDAAARKELVFVTLDVMVFWQEEALKLRAAILSRLGLRAEQLIVHPSHSHSTPMLLRKHADRAGGHLIGPYLDSLPGLFCELIEEARSACVEATLSWRYGRCSMALNRDAIDAGSGRDICGLNPHAPADDTVLVGRVTDGSGRVRASIVNYACHPVSLGGGNQLLSPDYVGAMRELIEKEVGGVCVFFHGASGDMTPRRSYESDVAAADQNGRELGYSALGALAAMYPPGQQLEYAGIEESGTALGLWRLAPKQRVNDTISAERITTTLLTRDMPTRAQIASAMAANPDRHELERLERAMDRRAIVGDGAEGEFYFTVWRLGDGFIVATPAEPYSEFQLALRARFPDVPIGVLNASDGCLNYLPVPSAFDGDVYQVRVALFQTGSLEKLLELAAGAIQRMR